MRVSDTNEITFSLNENWSDILSTLCFFQLLYFWCSDVLLNLPKKKFLAIKTVE